MLVKDKQLIGGRLFMFRKQKGLTQAETAYRAGISDRTYADIERGSANMRVSTLCQICDALSISPDDLLVQEIPEEEATSDVLKARFDDCNAIEKDVFLRLMSSYLKAIRKL